MKKACSLIISIVMATMLIVPSYAAMYKDTKDGIWYSDAVKYVTSNGYMTGLSEDLFSPNAWMKTSPRDNPNQ